LANSADTAAWSEFVEVYEQAIFRYSRSHGLQDADSWEVVQRVLLAVHQQINSWRPNGQAGSFRCWLLTTAHRICLSSLRDTSRRDRAVGGSNGFESIQQVPAAAVLDDPADDWERWAFCWAAGFVEQEVEPRTWSAFRLTAIDGMSAAEAARTLKIRVGSIYTARCRVIARIREVVQSLSRCDV
jgi:RNA polymerase sigma-70 factor (ECF subfamily)